MEEKGESLAHSAQDAGTAQTRPACIVNTEHEMLAKRFKVENETRARQEDLQRQITRAVVSVYYFARAELHMPHRPLAPEEFYEIRRFLKKRAERIIADPPKRRFWHFRHPLAGWRHYLYWGNFPRHRVFGLSNWFKSEYAYGIAYFLNKANFPVDFSQWPKWTTSREGSSFYIPPNFEKLVATLLKETVDGRHLGTLREHAGE